MDTQARKTLLWDIYAKLLDPVTNASLKVTLGAILEATVDEVLKSKQYQDTLFDKYQDGYDEGHAAAE